MTIDRSIEEPCEVTSLTHGFEAERRGRPLRLGSALYQRLKSTGLPIETSTGGRTKWNRKQRGIPKAHWLDAANVGPSTPQRLLWQHVRPLLIRAMGRQSRHMCRMDARGFPRTRAKKQSTKHAFQTGDIVRAIVPGHLKNKGVHVGRMASRASGALTIATRKGTVTDIGYRYCTRLQRNDGYGYFVSRKGGADSSQPPKQGL